MTWIQCPQNSIDKTIMHTSNKLSLGRVAVFLLLSTCAVSGASYGERNSSSNAQVLAGQIVLDTSNSSISPVSSGDGRLDVLFYAAPVWGHFNPVYNQAIELVRRGHRVAFYIPFEIPVVGVTLPLLGCPEQPLHDHKLRGVSCHSSGITTAGVPLCSLSESPIDAKHMMELAKKVTETEDLQKGLTILFKNRVVFNAAAYEKLTPMIMRKHLTADVIVGDTCGDALLDIAEEVGIPSVYNYPTVAPRWLAASYIPACCNGIRPEQLFSSLYYKLVNLYHTEVRYTYLLPRALKSSTGHYWSTYLNKPSPKSPGPLKSKSMVTLVNTAPGIDIATPLPSNIIYVGPQLSKTVDLDLHCEDPRYRALCNFLETHEDVLLVNFGTSGFLNETVMEMMIEGLTIASQSQSFSIVWRYNEWSKSTLPERWLENQTKEGIVHVSDDWLVLPWLPSQEAVLAHKNVFAFLTHGGNNSPQEALRLGKPLLLFPRMADQVDFAYAMEYNSLATVIERFETNPAAVAAAIEGFLDHYEDYKAAALRAAQYIKLAGGIERAADIIEIVARIGDISALLPANEHLIWWRYYNVDVVLVWMFVGVSLYFIFSILFKVGSLNLWRSCCGVLLLVCELVGFAVCVVFRFLTKTISRIVSLYVRHSTTRQEKDQ